MILATSNAQLSDAQNLRTLQPYNFGTTFPDLPTLRPPVPSNLFDLLHLIHSVVMEFSANLQFFWIWYYLPAGYQLAEMGFPWTMQNLSVGQWM